jgi:hypothetical protein
MGDFFRKLFTLCLLLGVGIGIGVDLSRSDSVLRRVLKGFIGNATPPPAVEQRPASEIIPTTDVATSSQIVTNTVLPSEPSNIPSEERYANGALRSAGNLTRLPDNRWVKHGCWTNYWANGSINTYGVYSNGIAVGPWPFWTDDRILITTNIFTGAALQAGRGDILISRRIPAYSSEDPRRLIGHFEPNTLVTVLDHTTNNMVRIRYHPPGAEAPITALCSADELLNATNRTTNQARQFSNETDAVNQRSQLPSPLPNPSISASSIESKKTLLQPAVTATSSPAPLSSPRPLAAPESGVAIDLIREQLRIDPGSVKTFLDQRPIVLKGFVTDIRPSLSSRNHLDVQLSTSDRKEHVTCAVPTCGLIINGKLITTFSSANPATIIFPRPAELTGETSGWFTLKSGFCSPTVRDLDKVWWRVLKVGQEHAIHGICRIFGNSVKVENCTLYR